MMMSSENNENKFSLDLCTNAQAHLQFLKLVHSNGTSLTAPSKESLRRYYDLWLPLVYEHRSLELIPPIDVAWIWHCDRLAPTQYENDLKELFGPECPILDAKAPFCLQTPNDAVNTNTAVFWKTKFPDEPFFLDEDKKKSKKADKKKQNQRLLASTEHQAKFLWQVSGPKYSSIDFLKQGVEEYYKFLNLRNLTTSTQNQIIVPTLQIDLMWHTHILSSLQAYHKDCIAIMKTRFNHDDSIKQKNLEEYFRATTALWKQHYEEDYFVAGGMNRGEPPKEFYKPEWAATSSAASASASTTATPSSPFSIVWCWKETSGRIETHDKSKIVGDPFDGWIQYDKDSNNKIEQAYQQQGNKHGSCVPMDGYNVNFTTMKQTKVATGYERDVERFRIIWCWQETEGQISAADRQNSLIGDPSDRMVKYDEDANIKIETAYQKQNGKGTCLPLQGYVLDFDTMKQMKMSTGYERKLERVPIIASNEHQPNKKKDPEVGGSLFAPTPYTPFATAVAVQEGDADPLSTADVTASGGVSTTATAAPATDDQDSKQTMYAMKWCLAVSCICCVCIVIVGIAVVLAVFFTTADDGRVDVQSIPSLSPATTSPTTSPIGTMTPAITSPTTSPNHRGGGRWACGRAPWSTDKQTSIDRPDTPLCLRIKPKQASNDFNILREPEGPLCMAGGEPLHQPPMWCYVDPSASTYKSYYLWWSPCTRCGTAWRLDEDRDDDKSMFKSPAEDPGPHGFPGDSWLRWTGSEWSTDVEMEITPCHPAECYIFDVGQYVPPVQTSGDGYSNNVQQESSGVGGGGLFGIIFGIILVFVIIACVTKFGGNGRGGRHSGGGCGGGGGGGGCGGGGGGCGGC